MFTHKLQDAVNEFITIAVSSGQSLSLTKGHYMYINGRLAPAKSLRKGDIVELGNGRHATVDSVSSLTKAGLYNPQTVHGDIVVNGIRASTYTTTVEPLTAHSLLTPLRALYKRLGVTTSLFNTGADAIAKRLPNGIASY